MFFLKTQALIEWKEESFFSVQIFFDLKLFLDHFERSGLFRKVYEIAAPASQEYFLDHVTSSLKPNTGQIWQRKHDNS